MHPLLTPANLATALIAVNFAAFAAVTVTGATTPNPQTPAST